MVGAGSSGSTLAYKLSDNTDWKILLIEAGGSETDFSLIPSFAPYLSTSDLDWGYYTEPQEYACKGSTIPTISSRRNSNVSFRQKR